MVAKQIEREIIIDAPVSRVWATITQPQHLGTWFGDNGAEVDLRPGGTMKISWKEHGSQLTTIERVEPERYFSWRWMSPAGQTPNADNSTLVEFSLTPEGNGTRLRVVETGFDNLALSEEERVARYNDNTQGWREELNELRDYAQRLTA